MSDYRPMGQFGIGQPIKRFEDVRLVRGGGCFHDDVNLPGQAHAVIVRSIHAHARIVTIDAARARRAPGVLAVFTGADVAELGTMKMTLKRKRPDGSPMWAPPHHGLTRERARYVGDPVAMVVADTLAQAEDAAELLEIYYEPLPAVTSTADAVGGPAVWEECPDNVSNVHEVGDRAATEAAFGRATRVVRRRYVITRVHAQYMEARGALGAWDPGEQRYTLHADVQYPHRVRTALATNILRVPEHQIRVIAGDVGGGFGTKGWQYPEHRLVLWAARKLGRPVKWRCERREAIPADEHARDNVTEAELALDAEGRFLALRVRTLANVGAYVSSDRNLLATFSNIATLVGVYAFPAAHVQVTSVLTNTNSTAPYRGAGRPEATYVIERLIDDAARELGADAVDLRRKNLVPAAAMPYKTTFKQILHERLGLDPADVRYIDGDTDRVAFGMGSMGSRSTVIGGTALWTAADKVIAKGRKIAAKLLEAAEADITFADGKFSVVGTDRAVALKEVARAAFSPGSLPTGVEPGLYETGTFSPTSDTWPNGCHVCEVEIDPETGAVALVAYVIADDVGTVINPLTLKGQIHGGVAQGVGQALMEQIVYDPDSGQLLTGSFMDYALPRADTLPDVVVESHPVPTTLNPLGAKGAGEAGTVGALPVVMNAVLDALAPLGVRHLDMPASAERVWNAIREARRP